MFQFAKLSKRPRTKPSQYILSTLVFFVFLLMWKFDCISWNWWYLKFPFGKFPVKFSNASRTTNGISLKFGSFYTVVEITNPIVAWQPVVFRILPNSSTSTNIKVGRSAFWGKATSELEISTLRIHHIGEDNYNVGFTPSFGGLYEIVIYLTYINGEQFEYYTRHVKSRMVNVTGSPFFILVQSRPPPENIKRYCSQEESGTAQGRWVKCGSLKDIERCGGWQLVPSYNFDKLHGYFWLPYTCQLHYYTNNEMKVCLAKNGWGKIIVTGDSHSRFRTYHWATRLYGACLNCGKNHVKTVFDHVPKMEWVFDARGTRWPATFPKSVRRPTEIYVHPKTRRSLFSDGLPNSTLDGDLYMMNFGHWIMREMTFKKFMKKKIIAFLEGVRLMNRTADMSDSKSQGAAKRKRFLWVNTVSLKWREDPDVHTWTMTPSPSTIGYLNSVLDRAMKNTGIQVVDAFQISNPRLTAIHDATHFAKLFDDGTCAGAVENAVTNVILNALCNK